GLDPCEIFANQACDRGALSESRSNDASICDLDIFPPGPVGFDGKRVLLDLRLLDAPAVMLLLRPLVRLLPTAPQNANGEVAVPSMLASHEQPHPNLIRCLPNCADL